MLVWLTLAISTDPIRGIAAVDICETRPVLISQRPGQPATKQDESKTMVNGIMARENKCISKHKERQTMVLTLTRYTAGG